MATTLQVGNILQKAQYPKDRGRSQEGHAHVCTTVNDTTALEAFRFPTYVGKKGACFDNWQKKERGFFNSLSYLENLYGFKTIEASEFPYPQNVKTAFGMACRIVREFDANTRIAILSEEDNPAFIATYMKLKTEFDFYHLPLQPLKWLRGQKKYKPEADLLTSICAYIYRIMDVDLFCDEGSHVYYQMTLVKDSIEQDCDEALADVCYDVEKAFKEGDILKKAFLRETALSKFSERVRKYKPKDEKSEQLLVAAKAALYLYENYPKSSIAGSMRFNTEFKDEDESGYGDETPFDAYRRLSFIWDMDTELYDQLWQFMTSEMDFVTSYNEPFSFQFFKEPQTKIELSLSFEQKAFELLELIGDFLISDIWKI